MKEAPSNPQRWKRDGNSHELSPEESHDAHPRPAPLGGGHRSGSRGAGTCENSDGDKTEQRSGPSGLA